MWATKLHTRIHHACHVIKLFNAHMWTRNRAHINAILTSGQSYFEITGLHRDGGMFLVTTLHSLAAVRGTYTCPCRQHNRLLSWRWKQQFLRNCAVPQPARHSLTTHTAKFISNLPDDTFVTNQKDFYPAVPLNAVLTVECRLSELTGASNSSDNRT